MAPHIKKKKPLAKEEVKEKLRERKKQSKQLLKAKRARLVVKNLPFKSTEENLKEYFQQYGDIENIELLKKTDGKLVGCCFIQFKLVQKAAKARHHTNGKPFLGRQIVVEFAKSKKKYTETLKEKEESSVDIELKANETVKELTSLEEKDCIKIEESDNECEEDNSDNRSIVSNSKNESSKDDVKNNKPDRFSNDITEGKTVFVKNVPFNASNDDLKQCMLQFGRIYYALICIDRLTEHSKGTAFVKFVNKEDADKALNAGTELTLLGNILDCHPALNRNDVQKKIMDKNDFKKQPKDSRNLYLVKEGVILAGSKAAQGVSQSDMAKRLQIEQYKTQMLRNLNMFVSKERIVIHNLPASWDDNKLRILMQKYAGKDAVIREVRVMKDMRNLDAKGIGKSKEYGFIAFTKHEHALQALRSLNNNPGIFSPQKRPIITFSIENKHMLNARQKRLEKSKVNNPTNKSFKRKSASEAKIVVKRDKNVKQAKKSDKAAPETVPVFSGVPTEPGTIQKMRSKYKLKVQAKLHRENLKKEKRKQKNSKKSLAEKRKEFIKQPKQKINRVKDTDDFSKLVNNYKKKLTNATVFKSKWFE